MIIAILVGISAYFLVSYFISKFIFKEDMNVAETARGAIASMIIVLFYVLLKQKKVL
jgi:hypothetical protein